MRVLAVANQKGGCGKTTTAINLSACLSKKKKNVLLIDMDPQGHATLGLGIDPDELEITMYEVLTPNAERKRSLEEAVIRLSDTLHLAPANVLLSAIEQELSGKPERETRLFQAISKLAERKKYDYVVIDCPPSLGLLTFNSLRAADELIAPLETSWFSLQGVAKLKQTVDLINDHAGKSTRVRALLTMFDGRLRFAKNFRTLTLEQLHGVSMMDTMIRSSVRAKEAAAAGKPVIDFDRTGALAQDFVRLAAEITAVSGRIKVKQLLESAVKAGHGPQCLGPETVFSCYAPEAGQVAIAGDFNGWQVSDEHRLDNMENGLWGRIFKLEPGKYRYKFVVDGEWITDPTNPRTEIDEKGNINSLLEI